MSEEIIRPWVNGKIVENGDLHLQDGIDGPDGIYQKVNYTIMSLKQRETRKWLKAQGWASPEVKWELLDVIEYLRTTREGKVNQRFVDEVIAKAKGEQG